MGINVVMLQNSTATYSGPEASVAAALGPSPSSLAAQQQTASGEISDVDERAARIAAIREKIDETGLMVGVAPLLTAGAVSHFAKALVRPISPQVLIENGAKTLCMPQGAGYPVTRSLFSERIRP
jgi:hypothetical protein